MGNTSADVCFNQKKKISKTDFHYDFTSKKGEIIIQVVFSTCAKFTYLHVNEADREKQ